MHTVDHVLCKSLLHNPISVVEHNILNANSILQVHSRVYVLKSFFRSLHVSVLKAPTIITVNTAIPSNVCNIVSHINPTYRIYEASK